MLAMYSYHQRRHFAPSYLVLMVDISFMTEQKFHAVAMPSFACQYKRGPALDASELHTYNRRMKKNATPGLPFTLI